MMIKTPFDRLGLSAIAAVTALLSTAAVAQDATPPAAAPPTVSPAPVVIDPPSPSEPVATPDAASDPLAPATTAPASRTTRTTRPTRATAAPPARPARAPVAAPPPPPADVTPVAEAAPAFDPAMVAPLPEPVAAAPVPVADDSLMDNDWVPIAGAAGLAILGLAGAALAMRRRRRRDEEEEVMVEETFDEPVVSQAEPVAVPTAPIAAAPLVAKPAFDWSNRPSDAEPTSWTEAAHRGPTSDNPSLSLKKRLQRAAFFEKNEQQVADGEAEPMSPRAGLPDSLADPSEPDVRPATRPDQGV